MLTPELCIQRARQLQHPLNQHINMNEYALILKVTYRVRSYCKFSCKQCKGDILQSVPSAFDQSFPTGCGIEAVQIGSTPTTLLDAEVVVRYYHGYTTQSIALGESYLSYAGAPFTPACKKFSSSTCETGSHLQVATREISWESGKSEEAGDLPNLVYTPPACLGTEAQENSANQAQADALANYEKQMQAHEDAVNQAQADALATYERQMQEFGNVSVC